MKYISNKPFTFKEYKGSPDSGGVEISSTKFKISAEFSDGTTTNLYHPSSDPLPITVGNEFSGALSGVLDYSPVGTSLKVFEG